MVRMLFIGLLCLLPLFETLGQSPTDTTIAVNDTTAVKLSDSTANIVKIVVEQNTPALDSLRLKLKEEAGSKNPSLKELISFGKIFWTIILLLIGYFSIKIITRILAFFSEKSAQYRITIKGLIPIVRIIGWAMIVYIAVAGIIKPPQATVIAFTASVGVAVAFASQDILKNIFAGIVVLFDRPFSVGDKIEIGGHYGEVLEIGLRSTRIVTPDDSMVAIPNAELMNHSVSNANSGEPNCQVVAEIYLPINVDTTKVRQIAIESAQVSKYVFLDKPIAVIFLNEVKEQRSYLKMRLKAYVMDIRFEFAFKSDMTEIVIKELLRQEVIKPMELF